MGNLQQKDTPELPDYMKKLGEETRYRLEFNKDNKCWDLFLPPSFRGIKPMCALCSFKVKNREDRIYFCERDKIFICKDCIVGEIVNGRIKSLHNCSYKEDQHEDKYVNIYIEEDEDLDQES